MHHDSLLNDCLSAEKLCHICNCWDSLYFTNWNYQQSVSHCLNKNVIYRIAFKIFKDYSNSCSLDLYWSLWGRSLQWMFWEVMLINHHIICEQWVRDLYLTFRLLKSYKVIWGFSCSSFCWIPERPWNHRGVCQSDLYSAAWEQKKNGACCLCCSAVSHSSNYSLCDSLQVAEVLSNLKPATLLTLVCRSLLYIVKCRWTVYHSFQLFRCGVGVFYWTNL